MAEDRDIIAVIVNYDGGESLLRCVESLLGQRRVTRVIVVDNDSGDPSLALVTARYPRVHIIKAHSNLGFGGGCNLGAAHADPRSHLLFLNPDIELGDGTGPAMAAALDHQPGVVGPAVRVEVSRATEYGGTVNHLGMSLRYEEPGDDPLYVPGCALGIDRKTFEIVGGFDSRYFLFVEDVELCWRVLRAGREVRVLNEVLAFHVGGGTLPGGYVRDGVKETTHRRVILRERNSLTLLLACAPMWWLPAVCAAYLVRTGLLAIGALALRRPALARGLLAGLVWNVQQFPATMARRRSGPSTLAGRRASRRRVRSGAFLLRGARDRLPVFLEDL